MSFGLKYFEFLSKSSNDVSQISYLGSTPNLRSSELEVPRQKKVLSGRDIRQHACRRVSTGGNVRSSLFLGEMPTTSSGSASSTRPHSLRSRASSAASGGLDQSQIHMLLNKRDSRASILTNGSQEQSPTGAKPVEFKVDPPRKTSNIITVKPGRGSTSLEQLNSPSLTSAVNKLSISNQKEDVPPKTETVLSSQPFLNDLIWKIDDIVYVGGVDAAQNMTLLCRMQIEFILDLSDEKEDDRRNSYSCLCSCRLRHSRYLMNLVVPPSEKHLIDPITKNQMNMNERFEEFIELVEKANKAKKCVLVCSEKARNKAPAFAAAYIMYSQRVTRAIAVQKVTQAMSSMRPTICISDFLQRSLMRYQTFLRISPDSAHDPAHTIPLFHIKRSAWT